MDKAGGDRGTRAKARTAYGLRVVGKGNVEMNVLVGTQEISGPSELAGAKMPGWPTREGRTMNEAAQKKKKDRRCRMGSK